MITNKTSAYFDDFKALKKYAFTNNFSTNSASGWELQFGSMQVAGGKCTLGANTSYSVTRILKGFNSQWSQYSTYRFKSSIKPTVFKSGSPEIHVHAKIAGYPDEIEDTLIFSIRNGSIDITRAGYYWDEDEWEEVTYNYTLAEKSFPTLEIGKTYKIEVRLNGPKMHLYIDGEKELTAQDIFYQNRGGYIGVDVHNMIAEFDNAKVALF